MHEDRREVSTHQAKLPTSATNLSKSAAPTQLTQAQNMTIRQRNIFFSHFTFKSVFPLRVKNPFSIIRTAGKSCNGTDKRMASEYKNCTA